MASKRIKKVYLLGWFPVDVKWVQGVHISESTPVHGEYKSGPNIIYVALGCFAPWSTFFHELWHKFASLVGDDDQDKMDADARRVETFLADLVTNHWDLLKELRKEKLKELEE